MNHLFPWVGSMCLIAMLLPACAAAPEPEPQVATEAVFDQAEEEEAIRRFEEQIVTAYNNHDSSAVQSLYVEDFENWTGTTKGLEAIEKGVSEFYARHKDVKAKLLDEIGIVFVTPDVAIVKARYEETGRLGEDGQPLPPYRYLEADVVVKKDGRWQRAAYFQRPIEE